MTVLSVWLFTDCTKLDKTKADNYYDMAVPVLNTPGNIIVNDNNKSENVTFTWSAADFGYKAVVDYAIYAVYDGGDPYELFSGIEDLQYTTTKEAFNLKLAGPKDDGYMGLPALEKSRISLYVTASIGSDYTVLQSDSVSVDVTTAIAVAAPNYLYIPGNHQNWSPSDAQVLPESDKKGVFAGMIDLHTDGDVQCEFKFTNSPDWDHINYGGTLSALETDSGAGNLTASSGFYYATVNTNDLTASITEMVPSLIGDFNSWNDDFAMSYTYSSTREDKSYSATLDLVAGEGFKIRFNAGWTYNFGADSTENEPVTVGEDGMPVTLGGKNMTVSEDGNYTVTLYYDYVNYTYRVKCTKN